VIARIAQAAGRAFSVQVPGIKVGLVAALLCGVACTDFADGDDTLPGETNALLEPGGPDWSCVNGNATTPRTPPTNSAVAPAATYSVTLTDFVTGRPAAGVQARACARVDVNCASPLTSQLTASADGVLRVPLFQGFDGYVEVLADGMVPALFFLNGPLERDTEGFPAFLVPVPALTGLATTVGVPIDPQFGGIGFWALDCAGKPAAGVLMSNDAGGQIYNFVAGLPAFQTTTADGIGGFINVPPGRVLLRGVLANGSQTIGVQSLLVRKNWLSISNLQPSG
jgi:hypothetical protein